MRECGRGVKVGCKGGMWAGQSSPAFLAVCGRVSVATPQKAHAHLPRLYCHPFQPPHQQSSPARSWSPKAAASPAAASSPPPASPATAPEPSADAAPSAPPAATTGRSWLAAGGGRPPSTTPPTASPVPASGPPAAPPRAPGAASPAAAAASAGASGAPGGAAAGAPAGRSFAGVRPPVPSAASLAIASSVQAGNMNALVPGGAGAPPAPAPRGPVVPGAWRFPQRAHVCVSACVCACARVRVCACARVRVCACARVRVCACARVRPRLPRPLCCAPPRRVCF
jgi:hypothetical protein